MMRQIRLDSGRSSDGDGLLATAADGKLDATKKILTLSTEGPSFKNPKKMAKFQDIITIKSKDHRMLTSRVQGDDGKWTQFMTIHYRRKRK